MVKEEFPKHIAVLLLKRNGAYATAIYGIIRFMHGDFEKAAQWSGQVAV
jgi:hypothetical protein